MYTVFADTPVGIDYTHGRFGEVTIKRCVHCAAVWLHYLVEYEAFSQSGRWFRGLIDEARVATITAEGAIDTLKQLEWHFYGGSYFAHAGVRWFDDINPDL